MALVIETFAGDSAPVITFNITRADGTTPNLTGCKVWFLIQDPDTYLLTNEPSLGKNNFCVITNAVGGQCTYTWNSGGTDLPDAGVYTANLKIEYATGAIETFPIIINASAPLAQIS